ncbi:MAG: hypothetical protein ABIT96_08160 [Ferruginibacter sp.]
MKTLQNFIFPSFLLAIIMTGCQKTGIEKIAENNTSQQFSVSAAKEWYYGTFKKSPEWLASDEKGLKLPYWKNGKIGKIGDLDVVEFPLVKESKHFSIPNINSESEIRKIAEASISNVLFIRDVAGKIVLREIEYVPNWNFLQKAAFDISFFTLLKDFNHFSGDVTVKSWNGEKISLRVIEEGQVQRVAMKLNMKLNPVNVNTIKQSQSAAAVLENCVTTSYCIWQSDCIFTISGDNMITNECGSWYNTGECWDDQVCYPGDEDECLLYGIGCPGGGCDPTLISPEQGEFNNYIMKESSPVFETPPLSNPNGGAISASFTWDVAKGQIANWSVRANTDYTYEKFYLVSYGYSYNLTHFNTGTAFYVGSNTMIQSTYTQINPTFNQIINNGTQYTQAKSHVVGSLRHVMGVELHLPFCPTNLDFTDVIDNWLTFTPN